MTLLAAGKYLSCVAYSEREKNRKSCRIVSMSGKETILVNPADSQAKKFKFDYSYWSHDGYVVHDSGYYAPADDSPYTDQVCVADISVIFCCVCIINQVLSGGSMNLGKGIMW